MSWAIKAYETPSDYCFEWCDDPVGQCSHGMEDDHRAYRWSKASLPREMPLERIIAEVVALETLRTKPQPKQTALDLVQGKGLEELHCASPR